MNRLRWLVLLALMLLVLLLILSPQEKLDHSSTQANTVSFQPDPVNTATEKQKTVLPADSIDAVEDDPFFQTTVPETEKTALSYLKVYQMTRLYAVCNTVIYGLIDDPNYDSIAGFQLKLDRLNPPDQPSKTPTQAQIDAITKHHSQCLNLKQQVEQLDFSNPATAAEYQGDEYHRLRIQLFEHLMQAKPQTSQEQAIAQVLKLKSQWDTQYAAVLAVSAGDESQNSSDIDILNNQIAQANARHAEIIQQLNNDQDNAELNDELFEISRQFFELQKAITNLKTVDSTLRDRNLAAFNITNDTLFQQLSSQYPEVFFEAQMALEKTQRKKYIGHYPYKDIGAYSLKVPFVEYVSPGDVVMQIVSMPDAELFGLYIHHATQLYLCDLGEDCGPNSEWVNYYCFMSYNEIHPESCGLNLPTYLQNHRLSPNQWEDVQMVLNVIRGLYE